MLPPCSAEDLRGQGARYADEKTKPREKWAALGPAEKLNPQLLTARPCAQARAREPV